MSRHVSRGSASEYQADEQTGVARLSWHVFFFPLSLAGKEADGGRGAGGEMLESRVIKMGTFLGVCGYQLISNSEDRDLGGPARRPRCRCVPSHGPQAPGRRVHTLGTGH